MNRQGRLGSMAVVVAMMAVSGSCRPAKSGGLVVWVESDLALPKDIDRVQLVVTESGKTLFERDAAVGAGNLLLPAPFRIAPPGTSRPVLIRAIAFKAGPARIERRAVVQIPEDFHARLRLKLDFLCAGLVAEDGSSSCGAEQTCDQGSCTSAWIGPERLVLDDPAGAGAAGGGSSSGSPSSCFDVTRCFAGAAPVVVDPASCSLALPPGAVAERLNIGLKLELGQAGICAGRECWVALEPGAGWAIEADRVRLAPGVCLPRPGPVPVVSVSMRCATMPAGAPPCGDWSSVDNRLDMPLSSEPDAMSIAPRDRVGGSCEGFASQACADCGTRTRRCSAGRWSEWSECTTVGVCSPAAAQSCGSGGVQACSSECAWGECGGQICDGPASRACGNCGTQRRSCDDGAWSDWSSCSDTGVCMPGASQSCGAGGSQACGGDCQWGGCGEGPCAGAPSEACGQCGTRTRTCDAFTRTWSAWSECTGQGVCVPDVTQACGTGGTQVCSGKCQWDALCGGQVCAGPATRLCGNCGVQTRSCDVNSGSWSEWSACTGEGECGPSATRACGAGGTQTCGSDCRWMEGCSGQICAGAGERTCGNCGMQTRACLSDTAQWGEWSVCSAQGVCAPGAARSCGAGGTQHCAENCQWETVCGGQMCAGPASQVCGNCGTQTRSCSAAIGAWSDWSVCSDQGICAAGATRSCGAGGTQVCNEMCRWNTSCSGQVCSGPPTQACGNCGTQSRSCDTESALWSEWSACAGQGACMPGTTQACGANRSGSQTCGASCAWGSCVLACQPQTQACGNCGTQTRACNPDGTLANWSVCTLQGACAPDTTRGCGIDGQQRCNRACEWGTCCTPETRSCGNCGTQTRTCSADGTLGAWSICSGQGACSPGTSQTCGGGASQMCSASCAWGTCDCQLGLTSCTSSCVDLNSDSANCAGCGRACGAGQACRGAACACSDPSRALCFGSCVDVNNDRGNCGGCGITCAADQACRGGLCGCADGLSSCDGLCVDLNNDPNNCGTCDNPCGISRVCAGAQCVCAGGLTLCDNACVDTQADRNNCGGCGINFACTPDETCNFGFCTI